MAPRRMLHKRGASGERTNALSDLAFRCWIVYRLAADDFGVMRDDPGAFIEAHPTLGDRKPRALQSAIREMATVGLVRRFFAQGLWWLYSPDWQDYETQDYATMTTRPMPPVEDVTPATAKLLALWPKGGRVSQVAENSPNGSANGSGSDPPEKLASHSAPHANANANAPEALGMGEWFWEQWRRAMRTRGVVLPLGAGGVETPTVAAICDMVPDRERLVRALLRFMALGPQERAKFGVKAITLGYFKTSLPDLLGASAAVPSGPCRYRHEPPCADDATCTRRYLDDSRRGATA